MVGIGRTWRVWQCTRRYRVGGAGRALLNDLFAYLTRTGITRLSVNTQSDNKVSLSLYQRMGFVRTGEQYPVYTIDVVPG